MSIATQNLPLSRRGQKPKKATAPRSKTKKGYRAVAKNQKRLPRRGQKPKKATAPLPRRAIKKLAAAALLPPWRWQRGSVRVAMDISAIFIFITSI